MISLLIPTRNRPDYLTQLCESIQRTVDDISRIEVLIGTDSDCKHVIDKEFPFVTIYYRERVNNVQSYFNWLGKMANGNLLWVLNDDIKILTLGWDEILTNKMHVDRPCYGLTHPVRFEGITFSEFPVISKIGANRLGYVMPEAYCGWAADNCIGRIYNNARVVIDCREISIAHLHAQDETHIHMVSMSKEPLISVNEISEANKLMYATCID